MNQPTDDAIMAGATPPTLTPDGTEYYQPRHGFTCFHCGWTFRDPDLAARHFGSDPTVPALCTVTLEGVQERARAAGLPWAQP